MEVAVQKVVLFSLTSLKTLQQVRLHYFAQKQQI